MFSSKYGKCQSGSISATPSAEMNNVETTLAMAVHPSPRSAPAEGHRGSRPWRSGERGPHQFDDLLLHRGTPLPQRVRHRPQVPLVEVGRVLEAQGRVSVVELAGVLEEYDDLAVLV